jgi:hypothetical protein
MDDEGLSYDEVRERLWPQAKAWWIEDFYDKYAVEVDTTVYWALRGRHLVDERVPIRA